MKLNKNKLLKFIRNAMSNLGYIEFDDNLISDANLFVKPEGDLFLTIGFTIHRCYDDAFTCSYYLSRTTRWAACSGDIPYSMTYVRPGKLMSQEERMNITVDENCKNNPLITDMWWNAFDHEGNYDNESLESFIAAIRLTENRVAMQPEVIEKIYASTLLETIYNDVNSTIELSISEDYGNDFAYIPKREVKGVPMKWFKAAEVVLRSRLTPKNLTPYAVKSLAADAFRVYSMRERTT
ncbi:MAG: hypothetical protein E7112_05400 [Bacteroidales bacterium]|nr:hypothetical protein [Bacteroidales bacterium]